MIGRSDDLVMPAMLTKQEELRNRTKQFTLRIIRLFQHLPHSAAAQVLGKQLLRSGTAVGANYRAAGRARSKAELSPRLEFVVEEAGEAVFWLECLAETGVVRSELLSDLQKEANELLAIFAASQQTARS